MSLPLLNPEETFVQFYGEHEHVLRVFETGDMSKLQEELQQQREQLQAIVNGLVRENLELKAKLEAVAREVEDLKHRVQELAGRAS